MMSTNNIICCMFLIATWTSRGFGICVYGDGYPCVISIQPNQGSINGGTKLTISGSGFPHDGYQAKIAVNLVSATSVETCDVFVDDCTGTAIACYTRPMALVDYYVRVYLNDNPLPIDHYCNDDQGQGIRCKFTPGVNYSPSINLVTPLTGTPGSLITVVGRILTSQYSTNQVTSTNGRTDRISRVWTDSGLCELRINNTDKMYGLWLDYNGYSDWGNFTCLPSGSFVGNQMVTFLVTGTFGRSITQPSTLFVTSSGGLAMYQTYAEVDGLSVNSGSVLGNTDLHIYGQNFDNTTAPLQITVGGSPCLRVVLLSQTELICYTSHQPVNTTLRGNRGVFTTSNCTDQSNPLHGTHWTDLASVPATNISCRTVMEGYFVAPSENSYQLSVSTWDSAVLSLGVNSDLLNRISSLYSDFLHLKKNDFVHFKVERQAGYAPIQLGLKAMNSNYTADQTSTASNEHQQIKITSQRTPDIQTIKFVSLPGRPSQSAVYETQTVELVSDNAPAVVFRLGMWGVWSGILPGDSTGPQIAEALSNVPVFDRRRESFGITSSETATGVLFTVVFQSPRGDFPLLNAMIDSSSQVNGSFVVTEVVQAQTTGQYVFPALGGVPGPLLSTSSLSPDKVLAALTTMLAVTCPTWLTQPYGAAFKQDYEQGPGKSSTGVVTPEVEPFCGRFSIRDPTYIYSSSQSGGGQILGTKSVLCFAYRGLLADSITVHYTYSGIQSQRTVDTTQTAQYQFPVPGSPYQFSRPKTLWMYTCVNLYTEIIVQLTPGIQDSQVTILGVAVQKALGSPGPLYVDTVSFSEEEVTGDLMGVVEYERLRPYEWVLDNMTVVDLSTDSAAAYQVTLWTINCMAKIPLYEFTHTQVQMSSDGSARYSAVGWDPNAYIQVARNGSASPAVNGSIVLSLGNITLPDFRADMQEDEVAASIESVSPRVVVDVARTGTCVGYTWNIEWKSPGDQPGLTVVSNDLNGTNVKLTVSTQSNGGNFWRPVIGDMLKTVHALPQVEVTVNGIASRCSGNCSFTWSQDATPVVTAVSASSTAADAVITITGSGFGNGSVTVDAGGPCLTQSVTATSVQCTPTVTKAGVYPVTVMVNGKGQARQEGGPFTVKFTLNASQVYPDPASGSVAGGSHLLVFGFGFNENTTVLIDSVPCLTIVQNNSAITCETPKGTVAAAVTITVSDGTTSVDLSQKFEYVAATCSIDKLSSNVALVEGGTRIELDISCSSAISNLSCMAAVGGAQATIQYFNDTFMELQLPDMDPGSYPLQINCDNQGYFNANVDDQIQYHLEVTNVYPTWGSANGGQLITIEGAGLSATENSMTVQFGRTLCDIQEPVTDTKLTCLTHVPSKLHVVTNQGKDFQYGVGFAWRPATINVSVGDFVLWNWSLPLELSKLGFRVVQVDRPGSRQVTRDGFSSGPVKTPNGMWNYQFTTEGTFYYWSDTVNTAGNIQLFGTVNVQPRSSQLQYLSLSVHRHEAKYNTSTGGPAAPDNSTEPCTGTVALPTGCTQLASANSSRFPMSFLDCVNPQIASIQPRSVAENLSITIIGSGFSLEMCQNEVTLDRHGLNVPCEVTFSNNTVIQCDIQQPCDGLPVGIPLEVQVRVNNQGYALSTQVGNDLRGVTVLPTVASITPLVGSLEGGQVITIQGSNLCFQCTNNCNGTRTRRKRQVASPPPTSIPTEMGVHSPMACLSGMGGPPGMGGATAADCPQVAELQISNCMLQNVIDANTLECATLPVYSNELELITVQILLPQGQAILAACTGNCTFTQEVSHTPTVEAISPNSITMASETITITGTKFGNDTTLVTVSIGQTDCQVQTVNDTTVTCTTSDPLVGTNDFRLAVVTLGKAASEVPYVTVSSELGSVTPSTGSLYGQTLIVVEAIGFDDNNVTVLIGGNLCVNDATTPTSTQCFTPTGHVAGPAPIQVWSNGVQYETVVSFQYTTTGIPTVTDVSPKEGSAGDNLTVTGTGFGTSEEAVLVRIGDSICEILSVTNTVIQCVLSSHAVGTYAVDVVVQPLGMASSQSHFTYLLTVASVTPNQGTVGGDQLVTLSGQGFSSDVTVSICGQTCAVDEVVDDHTLTCLTPRSNRTASATCDVSVSAPSGSANTLTAGYSYTLIATVTGVSPPRGGTGGGTRVTINGTAFGQDASVVRVTIAGAECVIQTIQDNQIVCVTGDHKPSEQAKVRVQLGIQGIARQDAALFEYIDVWSSVYTWGGAPLPVEGDFVIIPSDMKVLLDVSTPVLSFVLIEGGQLVFDDRPDANIELHADVIFISDGGLLQVGAEDKPYQGRAVIELHGNVRSTELPLYGYKAIALRQGTLHLHGKRHNCTWTTLALTAAAGSSQITLVQPVDWEPGSEIVIASTGDHLSQNENEKRTILDISADGYTITLNETLTYDHLGASLDFDGRFLEARAEVGLLTHNVVVRGSNNKQWHDTIPACPSGFNPGEFVTQTCFQGRFGEETGSDQYGAQIIMHSPHNSANDLHAYIENTELVYVGQAFRLGRYAIHFHMNGDLNGSYVRGCSIHRSFNRAVNVHATNNILIDNNVAFDIMGGAMFLEDGVEIGNVLRNNLLVFVRASTSLQNDDITPAAIWVTNANNTVTGNHAAGGTHFGFWYRMLEHPDGPSYTPNYCPRKAPMGLFADNVAHSQGWFGLWIFQVLTPMQGGCCGCNTPQAAKFLRLTAWNCEKGAEWVGGGALQFHDFFLVNNDLAGIEMKMIMSGTAVPYSESSGALINGGMIVAKDPSGALAPEDTSVGIVLPYSFGLLVKDVTFVHFNADGQGAYGVTSIQGTTENFEGGFSYRLSGQTFVDSDRKAVWRWQHEAVLIDLDGTLTGEVNGKIVTETGNLPTDCVSVASFSTAAIKGYHCPAKYNFTRFAFNNFAPASLQGKNASFTNQYGTSLHPFTIKGMTHPMGWRAVLVDGLEYNFTFVGASQITNISYQGAFYEVGKGQWLIINHALWQLVDHISITGSAKNASEAPLTYNQSANGDWFLNTANNQSLLSYIISGRQVWSGLATQKVSLSVYQCYYTGCKAPIGVSTANMNVTRSNNSMMWHNATTWYYDKKKNQMIADVLPHEDDGQSGIPAASQDVVIANGTWVVIANSTLQQYNRLYVYGILEIDSTPNANGVYLSLTLSCTHILLLGGRLIVGTEQQPMMGNVEIELRGNPHTEEFNMKDGGPTVGAKAIGVFGGLDLHGAYRKPWTYLLQTAPTGSTSITLVEPVDWRVGETVVLAPSGYDMFQSEVRTITGVSPDNRTLTLDHGLQYEHTAEDEEAGGHPIIFMRTEVGLLSRNIKVTGRDYGSGEMSSDGFGARILVSQYYDGTQNIAGFARISNVQFSHVGQYGFVDSYDPRFGLAFLDVGQCSLATLPCYIRNSTMADVYNTAVGTFGASGVFVENNVIYNTVGSSFILSGEDHVVRNNLAVLMTYAGTFSNRNEKTSKWFSTFEINQASNISLMNNIAAGSVESGFRIDGEPCSAPSQWLGNVAHSTLAGIVMLPDTNDGLSPCAQVHGFTTWKNWYWGVYLGTQSALEIVNHVSVDDTVGLYTMVIGPRATQHLYADKNVTVENSVFVGTSRGFDCDAESAFAAVVGSGALEFAAVAESWKAGGSGRNGLSFGTFTSGSNMAPEKPWDEVMAYQAINGRTDAKGVFFKNYGPACTYTTYAIAVPMANDDGIHPLYLMQSKLENVSSDALVYYFRPRVGKINPSDCVDMDCDGLKKEILVDTDGTFLNGHPGCVIAQAEWQWNGDPRRGLGDYRIPTTMLTDDSGNRISVAVKAPMKGIIRDPSCVYREPFQAYECHDWDYAMLHLESMDNDTESRRLSPVAVWGADDEGVGYVDLINGPQDHGWCMGYTCQKRLSLFPITVALNRSYEIYLSSTPPQSMRFHLLNTADDQSIIVAVYLGRSQNVDVFYGDTRVKAKNEQVNAKGQTVFANPTYKTQYLPTTNDDSGTSFFDGDFRFLHIIIKGSVPVTLRCRPTVLIAFNVPAMTIDEFFGKNIAKNLATFLKIPADKIKVAHSVREDRRKRATYINVAVQISNDPSLDLTSTNPSDLNLDQLHTISSAVADAYQTMGLSDVIGMTVTGLQLVSPPPDPSSPQWLIYTTIQTGDRAAVLEIPASLELTIGPSTTAAENETFVIQPCLRVLSTTGTYMTQLGTLVNPWMVTAQLEVVSSLYGDTVELEGTNPVPFINGWFNFTDLSIPLEGTYTLNFVVTSPASVTFLHGQSGPVFISLDMPTTSTTSTTSSTAPAPAAIPGVNIPGLPPNLVIPNYPDFNVPPGADPPSVYQPPLDPDQGWPGNFPGGPVQPDRLPPGFADNSIPVACSKYSCKNGGICMPKMFNEYTCYCLAGFTGDYCESDIDECASGPCLNGGTCFDGLTNFRCACPPGIHGDHCDSVASVPDPPGPNLCDPNPCLNNGTCVVIDATTLGCRCTVRFIGMFCENFANGPEVLDMQELSTEAMAPHLTPKLASSIGCRNFVAFVFLAAHVVSCFLVIANM